MGGVDEKFAVAVAARDGALKPAPHLHAQAAQAVAQSLLDAILRFRDVLSAGNEVPAR